MARLWDADSGLPIVTALWHDGPVMPGATFSREGTRVLTASEQTVRLWDITASEPLLSGREPMSGSRTLFSLDGTRLVRITGSTAQLHEGATEKTIGPALAHKHGIALACFSADSRRLATLSQKPGTEDVEAEVHVWDATTGASVGKPMESLSPASILVISPDGSRVVTASADQNVRIWDPISGSEVGRTIDHKQDVSHVVYNTDGSRLAVATVDGTVRVWDAMKGEPVTPALKHRTALTYVAFSSDGRRLITASQDGIAQLSDAATGEGLATPLHHTDAIAHVELSADGTRVATASADGTARVWDARSGEAITPPLRHDSPVSLVVFSPDDRWLATAAGEHVRLWEAATGELLSPALKHTHEARPISHVSFTKEGRLVTSHGEPGDAKSRQIWNLVSTDWPVQALQQIALVRTGHRLDASGMLVAAPTAEMREAWQALQSRHPAQFHSATAQLLAWHRRGADECESAKRWTGALAHLERLLELEPKRSDYRERRGRNFEALERWQDAGTEYRKALESQPNRGDLLAGVGRAEYRLKNWTAATDWLSRAVAQMPEATELYALRGRAEAELGQFEKASADLNKAMSLGLNDALIWHQHTLLRLAAGDLDGYRKSCQRMARRFGDTDDPATSNLVAWTCAVGPDALTDLKPILQRVERAAKDNPKSPAHQRSLAALLYRTGQFAAAVAGLEAALKQPGTRAVADTILLAMTFQRLNRSAEAKKLLEQTPRDEDAAIRALPWDERLALQLLRREAAKLVDVNKP
jgi:WD40 repeat protein/tetratricopeptide (TPR) repeat protein